MSKPLVERDRSAQILELDIPEPYDFEPASLVGALADLPRQRDMVSAAALSQKAKQFDDGLYAAVELAVLHGRGERPAKTEWLSQLRTVLGVEPAATTLYAAACMLDPELEVPLPLGAAVAERVRAFLADARSSKPISFYTWSEELTALFRHDRVLQAELGPSELMPLLRALHGEPSVRGEFERYLHLIERLSNPLKEDMARRALLDLDRGVEPSVTEAALIPASASHESRLIMRLYGDAPIPDDFELMSELLARVRSGEIDLKPTADSGWYDQQLWSLEALAIPDQTAEADRLRFTGEYRQHLEDLFRGIWALARETHAKQLDVALAGCALDPPPGKPILVVQPDLCCEPLITHYRRRADSYRFVRAVIEQHFGADALTSMHRQLEGGAVAGNLQEELGFMADLFDGAASTCEREIGASIAAPDATDAVFANWDPSEDPDLGADVRMMVPVFYDLQRQQTKVWAVLGWSERDLTVSFRRPPKVTLRDDAGEDVTERYDIMFGGDLHAIAYPDFAEIYVDQILDRNEFRALCDAHGTRERILAALSPAP